MLNLMISKRYEKRYCFVVSNLKSEKEAIITTGDIILPEARLLPKLIMNE